MLQPKLQLVNLALKKYSFGSVQITIPHSEPIVAAILAKQDLIKDSDLAGKGRENVFHVTVRYGIEDSDTQKIEEYLATLKAFTITLGSVGIFPPSENSDRAAVVYVEILSPELKEINKRLVKYGKFKHSDFEYNPHLTLAYIKPEATATYSGNTDQIGDYEVSAIEIRSKDKDVEPTIIQLQPITKALVAKFGKLIAYIPEPKFIVGSKFSKLYSQLTD